MKVCGVYCSGACEAVVLSQAPVGKTCLDNTEYDEDSSECNQFVFVTDHMCVLWQVGWYNAVLSPAHHLQYPADTLAVVVLSSPSMFERCFLPFLRSQCCEGLRDPIDQCSAHTVSSAVSLVWFSSLTLPHLYSSSHPTFFCFYLEQEFSKCVKKIRKKKQCENV